MSETIGAHVAAPVSAVTVPIYLLQDLANWVNMYIGRATSKPPPYIVCAAVSRVHTQQCTAMRFPPFCAPYRVLGVGVPHTGDQIDPARRHDVDQMHNASGSRVKTIIPHDFVWSHIHHSLMHFVQLDMSQEHNCDTIDHPVTTHGTLLSNTPSPELCPAKVVSLMITYCSVFPVAFGVAARTARTQKEFPTRLVPSASLHDPGPPSEDLVAIA